MVIILAIDDGFIGLSASLASSTVPVLTSIRKACLPKVSMPICDGVIGSVGVVSLSLLAFCLPVAPGAGLLACGLAGGLGLAAGLLGWVCCASSGCGATRPTPANKASATTRRRQIPNTAYS